MKALSMALVAILTIAPIQDDFKRERGGANDATKNG